MKGLKILVFTALFSSSFCAESYDYYWRDYDGEIPNDAVPGGLDLNNKPTYIGIAYIHGKGFTPAMIYPGKQSVRAAFINEVFVLKRYIQILCSSSLEHFKWIPVTADDFKSKMRNKHPVEVGFQENGVHNVGRISLQNEVIVGRVNGFLSRAIMYFADNWKVRLVHSYEVLVYENYAVY